MQTNIVKKESGLWKRVCYRFQEIRNVFWGEKVVFSGLAHVCAAQKLSLPLSGCRIEREDIKVLKLNARLYKNFLVIDGEFLLKAYYNTHDGYLKLEFMLSPFLTTVELPGLLPEMKPEFGSVEIDYAYTPEKGEDVEQTTFKNEIVLEIPYWIYKPRA